VGRCDGTHVRRRSGSKLDVVIRQLKVYSSLRGAVLFIAKSSKKYINESAEQVSVIVSQTVCSSGKHRTNVFLTEHIFRSS
jgi:hypothetical protein